MVYVSQIKVNTKEIKRKAKITRARKVQTRGHLKQCAQQYSIPVIQNVSFLPRRQRILIRKPDDFTLRLTSSGHLRNPLRFDYMSLTAQLLRSPSGTQKSPPKLNINLRHLRGAKTLLVCSPQSISKLTKVTFHRLFKPLCTSCTLKFEAQNLDG